MNNNIQQAPTTTFPSFLDAGASVIYAAFLSIVVACLGNLRACLVAFAIACALLVIARPPFVFFIKRMAAANLFILFIWLVVPFTTSGPTALRLGFLSASQTGIDLCLLATIKANALLIIFMGMVAPIPLSSLGNVLRRLRCPDKLAWLFLLMSRNVHILSTEWTNLRQAAKLRGFEPGTNKNTYRALASMLAILLIRSHSRAQRMREAMLLRGYTGKLPLGDPLRFTWKDVLVGFLFLCCAVMLIYMDFVPHAS